MPRPIIDLHSHWFSPAVLDLLSRRVDLPRVARSVDGVAIESAVGRLPLGPHWTDIDHRLDHLDRYGVVHQLISWPTTLNLEPALPQAEAAAVWRTVNDDFGKLVRRHPDRFSALAALSTDDVDWSIGELRRAHHELGLVGFVLPINVFASGEGVRHLAPLLDEAQRLGSHLYLHTGYGAVSVPGQPAPVDRTDSAALGWTLAAAHHFASAFATVALTDALDEWPDITVQVAMLGGAGAAALLAEQVTLSPERFGDIRLDPTRLGRLFLDTGALGQGPAAIGVTVDVLGAGRVVFGSDYAPAADIGTVLRNVAEAPIRADELDAILFDNAAALLARLGVAVARPTSSGAPLVRV